MVASLVFGLALPAHAVSLQRIGHTILVPRHNTLLDTNGVPLPDDKGMYTAFIDPTSGYAYFVGTYLFKLDITGNLPAQVGPAFFTGQFSESAIDSAARYAYMARTTLNRYALGAGTNPVSSAGSLALAAGSAACVGASRAIFASIAAPASNCSSGITGPFTATGTYPKRS